MFDRFIYVYTRKSISTYIYVQDASRVDQVWQVHHQRVVDRTPQFSHVGQFGREHFDSWFPILPTYTIAHIIRVHIYAFENVYFQMITSTRHASGYIYPRRWHLATRRATLALLDLLLLHWCCFLRTDVNSSSSRNPQLWLEGCPPVPGFSLAETAAAVVGGEELPPSKQEWGGGPSRAGEGGEGAGGGGGGHPRDGEVRDWELHGGEVGDPVLGQPWAPRQQETSQRLSSTPLSRACTSRAGFETNKSPENWIFVKNVLKCEKASLYQNIGSRKRLGMNEWNQGRRCETSGAVQISAKEVQMIAISASVIHCIGALHRWAAHHSKRDKIINRTDGSRNIHACTVAHRVQCTQIRVQEVH